MDGLARLLFAIRACRPLCEKRTPPGGPCHLARWATRFFCRSAFAQVGRAKSPIDQGRLEETEKSLWYYFKELS